MSWVVLGREGEERPPRGTILAAVAPGTLIDLVDLVCGIERVSVLRTFTTTAIAPLARVARPDLILATYRLPDGPTPRALHALRLKAGTSAIPVYGICDPEDEEVRQEMREAGCRGFLPPTFKAGEFLDLLRACLPLRSTRSIRVDR